MKQLFDQLFGSRKSPSAYVCTGAFFIREKEVFWGCGMSQYRLKWGSAATASGHGNSIRRKTMRVITITAADVEAYLEESAKNSEDFLKQHNLRPFFTGECCPISQAFYRIYGVEHGSFYVGTTGVGVGKQVENTRLTDRQLFIKHSATMESFIEQFDEMYDNEQRKIEEWDVEIPDELDKALYELAEFQKQAKEVF